MKRNGFMKAEIWWRSGTRPAARVYLKVASWSEVNAILFHKKSNTKTEFYLVHKWFKY